MKEFDSQRDMFVDSSGDSPAPAPKRSRDDTAATAVGPTQMISDASQTVGETQEIEEGTSSSSPPAAAALKGSEWIRAVEEHPRSPLEDDEMETAIESVGSSEARGHADDAPFDDEAGAANAACLSSTKKRRKKFGLAAKLESVLKQHRSDLALQEHLVGEGEAMEELYLTVTEVIRRDAFMTELRCVSDDSGEEMIVVVRRCPFVTSEGCEIRVRGSFYRTRNYVYGVKKLELLDQNIGNTRKKREERKVLVSWNCPCSLSK